MLGKNYEEDATDDDDDSKEDKKRSKSAKDDDEEDEFPNEFVIRSVDINPLDNSIIITSEVSQYRHYSYTNRVYNNATRTYQTTIEHVHIFSNQDILVINADATGSIKWLNAIPKSQEETIRTSSQGFGFGYSAYGYDYGGFFATGGGMPYYSSFSSLVHNNKLVLILNDHISNNIKAKYGDRVKRVYNFKKKSNTYGITIDLVTGALTRKFIFANNTDAILMPRHGYVVGSELIVPSWRMHALAKTELKFAKIVVK